MEWYYWVLTILTILYFVGKKDIKKSKIASNQKKDSSTSNSSENQEKVTNIKQTVLRFSDEIPEIKKIYLGYFDNWQSSDFSNLEKVETHFYEFTTHFKLHNTFKKKENKIRFFRGLQVNSRFELIDFPEINTNDLDKLKKLIITTYSEKEIENHRFNRNGSDFGYYYSIPVHDEINNLESKLSLRKYFYALELSYGKFISSNSNLHKSIFSEINLLLDQLKQEFSELKIEENIIRDDLYNILLNILKLIDDGHSLLENMKSALEVPIYKNVKNNQLEGLGQFLDVIGGISIDGVWHEKRSRRYYYTHYTFNLNANNKERLYGAYENNLLKIEEIIFSYISIFMIIMKDFISSSKTNKYLVFRLDIEKKGVLLNHFETTLLSKIDEINFNLIDLNTILKKNHIEIMQSLNEINQNISNMNSGLSMVSTKLNEINSTTNHLTTLQKWNNLFTVANLHYTIKTSNYLKNK
jgi:hypothetical protein